MTFEDVIVRSCDAKIAKLYPRAKKAIEKPDTGVKILVKGARYVIRDCAKMAVDYLPILLYGTIAEPEKFFNKKFTKKNIRDFVIRSIDTENGLVAHQLMVLILDGIAIDNPTSSVNNEVMSGDIYESYDSLVGIEDNEIDLTNVDQLVELLINTFGVKGK